MQIKPLYCIAFGTPKTCTYLFYVMKNSSCYIDIKRFFLYSEKEMSNLIHQYLN